MTLTRTSQLQTQPPAIDASPIPTPADTHPSTDTKTIVDDYLSVIFEHLWSQLFPSQGSLLLDQQGQLTLSTPKARELCQAIQYGQGTLNNTSTLTQEFVLSPRITTLCELLIESINEFPTQQLLLQEELFGEDGLRIHLKAEWIHLTASTPQYILVTLEDLTQVAHQRSLCDAYR